MKKTILITMIFLFSGIISNVFGYETDWNDPKSAAKDAEAGKANSKFSVGGQLYLGYDFMDKATPNLFAIDAPGSDRTGFRVGRAHVDIKGEGTDGALKGWDYRVLLDATRASTVRGGAGATNVECPSGNCVGNNNYLMWLKNAYVTIPVPIPFGKTGIRIGIQGNPMNDGQAGYNQTATWGQRHLDTAGKTPWDETNMSVGPIENGISLIHKTDFYGVHLMLGNGEGMNKSNAEGLTNTAATANLTNMANGDNGAGGLALPSYGQDLMGIINFIPTGKNKDLKVTIGFPFRMNGVLGIDKSEYKRFRVDVRNPNAYNWEYYEGDKKSLQDVTYGAEANVELKKDSMALTVGGGYAVRNDKGSSAYKLSGNTLYGLTSSFNADGTMNTNIASNYAQEGNRQGDMTYGFVHGKVGKFGAFYRIIDGSEGAALDGKVYTRSKKSTVARIMTLDASDNILGNYSAIRAYQVIGMEDRKGTFSTETYGVTYFANERFKISLGMQQREGKAANGRTFKNNWLENIEAFQGGTNVASQIASSTVGVGSAGNTSGAFWQNNWRGATTGAGFPYVTGDIVDLNDWAPGKKRIDTETWIRAEFVF